MSKNWTRVFFSSFSFAFYISTYSYSYFIIRNADIFAIASIYQTRASDGDALYVFKILQQLDYLKSTVVCVRMCANERTCEEPIS